MAIRRSQPPEESWPANVANTRHTVDFRRSWVPSPEVRGLFPPHADAAGTGTSTGTAPPVLPGSARSARTRTYHGDEEKRGTRVPREAGDAAPFTRARTAWTREHEQGGGGGARARERGRGREWEDEGLGGSALLEPRERGITYMHIRRERDDGGSGRAAAGEYEVGGQEQGSGRRERPRSWLSLLSPKKLFRKSRSTVTESEDEESIGRWGGAHRLDISPSEWRAYGAWARPLIGKPWGMVVRNATPLDPPRELSPPQVDAMFASLREPDGTRHPENWIPRVEHHSLPPRPDLWPTPRQTYDPLPGELQLNPFLEHRVVGLPPLRFDLRMRTQDILLGERLPSSHQQHHSTDAGRLGTGALGHGQPGSNTTDNNNNNNNNNSSTGARRRIVDFWADGPNGAQPATHPGVPRLRISALAEDAQDAFPWPVTVLPHHEALPVLVGDVLDALIANFEERLTPEEVGALSEHRKTSVYQAYWRRMRLVVGGRTPPEDDGLRRVDYLGDATFFRGLEPAPGGDGYMLFLGAPP